MPVTLIVLRVNHVKGLSFFVPFIRTCSFEVNSKTDWACEIAFY